jgi:hypothetical protein
LNEIEPSPDTKFQSLTTTQFDKCNVSFADQRNSNELEEQRVYIGEQVNGTDLHRP